MAHKPNPYGGNQYQLDPRQKMCWDYYIDIKSETYSNAKQSALKSGYEEGTADKITSELWFVEKVRRLNMLGKAEKVLDKTLDYKTENRGKVISEVLRIQTDVAKFIAKTQGKDEGYSERTEMTGLNGSPLIIQFDKRLEDANVTRSPIKGIEK